MAPETITFVNMPIRIGQVTLTTSEEETRMAFMTPGQDGQPVTVLTTTKSRHVRREEVVAIRENVAERLRVTFIEDVSTVDTGGQVERAVGPLAGNTFEVERRGENASIGVFEVSGAPARFGIAAQVSGHYRQLGRKRPRANELPVGPQKVGQPSRELAEAMLASASRGATITSVDFATATLLEIHAAQDGTLHGLYGVEIKIVGSSGGSKVTMSLSGTMLLRDADGATLEVKLSGPVNSEPELGPDGQPEPTVPPGAGEFKLTQSMVYSEA